MIPKRLPDNETISPGKSLAGIMLHKPGRISVLTVKLLITGPKLSLVASVNLFQAASGAVSTDIGTNIGPLIASGGTSTII